MIETEKELHEYCDKHARYYAKDIKILSGGFDHFDYYYKTKYIKMVCNEDLQKELEGKIKTGELSLKQAYMIARKQWDYCEVVYFVQHQHSRKIKIGTTGRFQKRFDLINIQNGGDIEFLMTLRGGKELEKEMHEKFKNSNCCGEWFYETPEITTFIKQFEITKEILTNGKN